MARSLSLAPAAVGLVLANVVGIVAVIGSCLTATRAAEARDSALAALAEARVGRVQPAEATVHASAPKARIKRMFVQPSGGVARRAAIHPTVIVRHDGPVR